MIWGSKRKWWLRRGLQNVTKNEQEAIRLLFNSCIRHGWSIRNYILPFKTTLTNASNYKGLIKYGRDTVGLKKIKVLNVSLNIVASLLQTRTRNVSLLLLIGLQQSVNKVPVLYWSSTLEHWYRIWLSFLARGILKLFNKAVCRRRKLINITEWSLVNICRTNFPSYGLHALYCFQSIKTACEKAALYELSV